MRLLIISYLSKTVFSIVPNRESKDYYLTMQKYSESQKHANKCSSNIKKLLFLLGDDGLSDCVQQCDRCLFFRDILVVISR